MYESDPYWGKDNNAFEMSHHFRCVIVVSHTTYLNHACVAILAQGALRPGLTRGLTHI